MNKTLRIVAKDTRHLWPEIAISLAITAGFVATDHFGWPQYGNDPFREASTLRTWMQILMPITWWLLVSRAVHDEPLVGDRQFWITRPYGWPRVLAAKLIFIAAFILLPYLLAQAILLQEAHLHPLHVLPGLAFTLAAIFLLFLLPLLALATVTATISRVFIIFFGLAVYAGLALYFGTLFGTPPAWNPGSNPPYVNVAVILGIVIVATVTVLQYARRRTRLSIALLLGLVAIITAGGVANYHTRHRIEDFPAVSAGETAPLRIALDSDPRHIFPSRSFLQLQAENPQPNEMQIDVPVAVSGISANHGVRIDAETLTVSGDGHPSVTIPWNSQSGTFRFSDATQFGQSEPMLGDSKFTARVPRWLYGEFANRKITIHLTYAVTEFEAEAPVNVPFYGQPVDVPEHGRCFETAKGYEKDVSISCQYAVASPSLTHVTWSLHENCGPASGLSLSRERWIGSTEGGWRESELSPVVPLIWGFETNAENFRNPKFYQLCSGSSFTFTKYHVSRRRLIEVTLPPLDLSVYIPPPKKTHEPLPATAAAPPVDTE